MKSILFALAAIASTDAPAAERRYTVTDFDSIRVEGPFQVTMSTGKPSSATASGSQQAIDRVSIRVEGRVLRIRPNLNAWGGNPGQAAGPLKIALSAHGLRNASVVGSGSLLIDKAKAMSFDASVAGSGRLAIGSIEADRLSLGLMGSGQIQIGGKAKNLKASIHGGGDLDANGLTAEDAVIAADTAGAIGVGVRRTAKVTATGAGDVEIIGSPACTVDAKGAGQVLCGKKR